MSFFEWLGRVVMLVLAGMITLSIIGAIAAIPYGSNLPRQMGIEQVRAPKPRAEPVPQRTSAPGADAVDRAGSPTPTERQVAVAPAPPDPAEWLEVIAYALLALTGLGALGILLIWRSLHQRRRIADALEALSAAAPPSSFAPPNAA